MYIINIECCSVYNRELVKKHKLNVGLTETHDLPSGTDVCYHSTTKLARVSWLVRDVAVGVISEVSLEMLVQCFGSNDELTNHYSRS